MKDQTSNKWDWWKKSDGDEIDSYSRTNQWSSYWMNEDDINFFFNEDEDIVRYGSGGWRSNFGLGSRPGNSDIDIIKAAKLASIRRAISNFVSILTNNSPIKVMFSSGEKSFTTGDIVVISADTNPSKFDSMVGTALHESAHCIFSSSLLDKDYMSAKWGSRFLDFLDIIDSLDDLGVEDSDKLIFDFFHWTLNVIEDRRIDKEVYTRAVGYRPYYKSFYNKYWDAYSISMNLVFNPELYIPTVQAYRYRITNITNPATKYTVDVLPDLDKIFDIFNLKDILRFSHSDGCVKSSDIIDCACEITKIVFENYIEYFEENDDEEDGDQDNGSGSKNMYENFISDEDLEKLTEELEEMGFDTSDFGSDTNLPNLDNLLNSQRFLIENDFDKEELGSEMNSMVEAMEESSAHFDYVDFEKTKIPVMKIHRVTEKIIETVVPNSVIRAKSRHEDKFVEDTVKKGIRLGQLIVDRLKIRHNNNDFKQTRKNFGKIDKRLVYSLSYDNENVFYKKTTESYKDSIIYLTIDGSSSMIGSKWSSTVVLSVGLAYAATKINNFDIIVDLRYGLDAMWNIRLFDSRRDTFTMFRRWIKEFVPHGSTPESLLYEAMYNDIVSLKNVSNEIHMVTLTDGQPTFSYYNEDIGKSVYFGGELAYKHCKSFLSKLNEININVLPFFIYGGSSFVVGNNDGFTMSYGKRAKFVPEDKFSKISDRLNSFLTEKFVT